jgi:cytochrome c5
MSIFIRTAVLLACVAVASPSRGQTADERAKTMPEGPGRSLVTTQCVGCHTLDVALSKRGTADDWRATVQAMIDRGATITAPDAAAIASYLGQHYGPTAAASGSPAGALVLPDGPGKDVLMRKCFQCHQMSMWTALRQDRRAWEGVIYRMIGRGGLWTEDEVRAMADYLARIRGPQ